MKQSDIAVIILVVGLTLVISFLIGNTFINSPDARTAEVEEVRSISAEFPAPSGKVFVEDFINPTELIEIGNSKNQQPFPDSN